ncbi:helix-turn-helix domain-containing protein [Desertivirga arenae]|uniref:helix-turn-helix domain-containing protein n=1 Tax=Desertivirga arenae TaxID=2810309 RepID=UPI001A958FA9|nr:helix-turn-helix domain-containing protein [Pedobacter sp. SYSU D00823]
MSEEIVKYEFKHGLPIEFEIVDITELYRDKREMIIRPHRTGFYHIIWIQKGGTTHIIDFQSVTAPANTILFLNKDIVQMFNPEPFQGQAILFTEAFFSKSDTDIKFLKENVLFNDLFSISKLELDSAGASFEVLLTLMQEEALKAEDAYQSGILKNFLHSFLLLAERERRKNGFLEVKKGADKDYIILFRDLLEGNFKHQKQVNFYASKLSVTEKRLNQATSKILGKTVKQVIDERVMLEAKRLLAHTTDSIKEVGFTLGFEEPTNFIKYFKKHNSSTPFEFRENFL